MKFILILSLVLVGCQPSAEHLPKFGQMPVFQLSNQDAKNFSSEQLKGKVWVGNFIFTSCGGACPLLTQRMKGVEREIGEIVEATSLRDEVHIISFSVDPERDTPERLKAYMQTYGCNEELWTFLTGPLQEITRIVVHGFKISMGKVPTEKDKDPSEAEIFEVVHGEKFILVDRAGQIRGYYDSDRTGLKKLILDFKALLHSKGAST